MKVDIKIMASNLCHTALIAVTNPACSGNSVSLARETSLGTRPIILVGDGGAQQEGQS